MRRFIKSDQGVVTVYLLIIFVSVFFFCGVLIDLGRIMVAQRELQGAVHAGVRSVLANYSGDLKDYGLYAVNTDEAEELNVFKTIVSQNLSGGIEDSYFRLVDTRLEGEPTLLNEANLGQADWLERQMVEEMKYKGAIESFQFVAKLVTGIVNVFGGAVGKFMKNGKVSFDGSDEDKLYDMKHPPKDKDGNVDNSAKDQYEDMVDSAQERGEELARKYVDGELDEEQANKLMAKIKEMQNANKAFGVLSANTGTYEEPSWFNFWSYWNLLNWICPPLAKALKSLTYCFLLVNKLTVLTANQDEFANEVMINEYILMHFNHCKLGDPDGYPSHLGDHPIKDEEVEYIIYGQTQPGSNLNIVLDDLTCLRFGIRFLDVVRMGDVEPITAAICAGFWAAYDMYQLLSGESIQFSTYPGLSFNTTYADHLRLFLLLPSKDEKLARVQGLLDTNMQMKNNDLTYHVKDRPLQVKGTVTASVKLFFLPTIIKTLNYAGAFQGRLVGGNRYRLEATGSMYY